MRGSCAFFFALGLCAAVGPLAGCGRAQQPITAPNAVWPSSARPATAERPNATLSGEKFSADGASSTCSSKSSFSIAGTFHASGKARGPYPGKFTAHAKIKVTLTTLSFREEFQIRSGSQLISGVASIPSSFGSPTFACSKSGQLGFAVDDLRYRAKRLHAHGSGGASLYSGRFDESFQ